MRDEAAAGLQRHAIHGTELSSRRRVEEDHTGVEHDEARRAWCRARQQIQRQRRHAQGVDAQHTKGHAVAVRVARIGVDFEHRAGVPHKLVGQHALKQRVVKTFTRAANRQVGFAVS